jgi:hypothetical protein
MAPYFSGVVPTRLAITVVDEAAQLFNFELVSQAIDHTRWNLT